MDWLDKLKADALSPYWWIGTVFIAALVNIVSSYARDPIDKTLSRWSATRARRREAERALIEQIAARLAEDQLLFSLESFREARLTRKANTGLWQMSFGVLALGFALSEAIKWGGWVSWLLFVALLAGLLRHMILASAHLAEAQRMTAAVERAHQIVMKRRTQTPTVGPPLDRNGEAQSELIALPEVARLAFEAVEGSEIAEAASHPFHAPKGALAYMASMILHRVQPEVVLHGKRLPSTQLRPVESDAFFAAGVSEDASEIRDDQGRTTHTELSISPSDLPRIMDYLAKVVGQKAR